MSRKSAMQSRNPEAGGKIIAEELLASAPEMGVPMPERPGTRFFPLGSYLIIYRPDAARQTV